jgi:protein-L-isoaspartate(D-aspartate) O-methyltransferase
MHAHACESLLPYLQPGCKVLDIGSGSGYLTHVLAELVKPEGKVVGVDHIQPLVDMARENMAKSKEGKTLLDNRTVEFFKADGRLGYPTQAPYDAIHVGAAAAEHHQTLVDQLKAPGRLFVPVEEGYLQHIYVVDKDKNGKVERKKLFGVQYVPLTDAPVEGG